MFSKRRGKGMKGLSGAMTALAGLMLCGLSCMSNVYAGSSSFKIVDRGKPAAAIIIGEKAGETERFAASELQKYILQMSGASLPIRKDNEKVEGNSILVGSKQNNTKIAQLGRKIRVSPEYPGKEGYIIKVAGNNLILAGSDSTGTLYSVYELLETLGCRWFFPNAGWEIIQASKDISISRNINKAEKPDFKSREVWAGVKNYDWLAKNRFNYIKADIHVWNDWLYEERCLADLGKRGISWGIGGHSFNYFLPVEKYFAKHQEYYALINGKRMGEPGKRASHVHGPQYCWSNPDVAKEVAKNICEFLDEYPECPVIDLHPNDNSNFCQCEKCMALEKGGGTVWGGRHISRSRGYLAFANKVAEIVARRHPDTKIDIFGYEYSDIFDISGDAKGHPNLRMIYYLYFRDTMRALDSPDSSRNKAFAAAIDTWRECLGNENLIVADYYFGMAPYKGMIFPVFDVISKDFAYFKKAGISGVGMGTKEANFSYQLNSYLFSRFAWNANSDLEEILNDFCAKSFGKADTAMKRYLDLLILASKNIDLSRTYQIAGFNGCKDEYQPFYRNVLVLVISRHSQRVKDLFGPSQGNG